MSFRAAVLSLHLPHRAAARGLRLEHLLADRLGLPMRHAHAVAVDYALTNPELRFAVALLAAKPNLWLFRCHQRRYCGDFAVVDMSVRPLNRGTLQVLELKMGAPLRRPRVDWQMRNAEALRDELAGQGWVKADAQLERLAGGNRAVLEALGV